MQVFTTEYMNIVTPRNELCLAIVTIVCDCKLCWGKCYNFRADGDKVERIG